MLPLLDYSAKKERMLQEYSAQLSPQLEAGEPWADAHQWAILTGEVEVLVRETVQLYTDLLKADEFHHACTATQPQYPYAQVDEQIEHLFHQLRGLLAKEIELTRKLEAHGYSPKGQASLAECLRAVDVLLADESPIYATEAFQIILQQSLDDIKAGRLEEMRPEQL